MISKNEEDIVRNWDKNQFNTPVVSIRCIAYNHEKYIAQCLDGFLMQETTFPFQIVVHDDASTDNTASIIRTYEEKYPHIIVALYEEENLYSKKDGSLGKRVNSFCKGKYIALCEGDDYWTDKKKLQLQYEALENNPDCSMCTCLVQCCNEDGTQNVSTYPCAKYGLDYSRKVNEEELIRMLCPGYPFHTSSYFIRKEAFFYSVQGVTEYFKRDDGIMLKASLWGIVYYINQPMSMRRFGAKDGWVARVLHGGKRALFFYDVDNYFMFLAFEKITKGRYREIVFPHMISILVGIISYDREKAIEIERNYICLIGDDEYKNRFSEAVKKMGFIDKFKLRTFKKMPLIYDSFSKVWHLLHRN